MAVPGVKICARCGADVSGRRRVKDESGHYYCPACAATVAATAPRRPAGGDFTCSQCRGAFEQDEVYDLDGQVICHECYADMAAQRGQRKKYAPPKGKGTGIVVFVGVLAVV